MEHDLFIDYLRQVRRHWWEIKGVTATERLLDLRIQEADNSAIRAWTDRLTKITAQETAGHA